MSKHIKFNMKYDKELMGILTSEYQSTNDIRIRLEKKVGVKVNHYSILIFLNRLLQEKKVQTIKIGRTEGWKKA